MHTDREGSRSRIEDLLQTGYRQNGAHGEPNLFLFLKEPECVSCSRELLFWNQLIAQNARLHVIVVFPGSSAMNGTQVSSLPHFRYPVVRLDENSYEEIMGGSSGVVGRILLAPNGQVMHAEVVGAGDPIATGLMIFLQQ